MLHRSNLIAIIGNGIGTYSNNKGSDDLNFMICIPNHNVSFQSTYSFQKAIIVLPHYRLNTFSAKPIDLCHQVLRGVFHIRKNWKSVNSLNLSLMVRKEKPLSLSHPNRLSNGVV